MNTELNNAAKRYTFAGEIFQTGFAKAKEYVLTDINPAFARYHKEGFLHIHDLEAYGKAYNCLTIDIVKGFPFDLAQNWEPNKQILFTFEYVKSLIANIANEQAGGISFANFDAEISQILNKLNVEANVAHLNLVRNCVELLIEWINQSRTRYSQECYYVSLNIGLAADLFGREIIASILDSFSNAPSISLVIRPNIIFKVHNLTNLMPKGPNHDLLLKSLSCTSKKMNPTYLLCDSRPNVDVKPKNLAIMGCRTRVVSDIYGESTSLGRGNIAYVTVNLPRLAFETVEGRNQESNEELYITFIEKWNNMASVAKDILLDRYETLINKTSNFFPANKKYRAWCCDFEGASSLADVFKHGTLSIGFIGLSEVIEILFGHRYYVKQEANYYAIELVREMRRTIDKFREEFQLNFTLLATSGEYISGRFPQIDYKLYRNSITEKGFYTNSFHVNVDSDLSIYEKLKFEGKFHCLCNGGSISYVELESSPIKNVKALLDIILASQEIGISYLGFNFPMDICENCGTQGTFERCTACGSNHIKRIRRVSGYLEELDYFTKGKKAEVERRKPNIR